MFHLHKRFLGFPRRSGVPHHTQSRFQNVQCRVVIPLQDGPKEFLRSKPTSAQPAQGRVLVVLTHSDTGCAEGTQPSDGVIDINDLPPWDTWFGCILAEDHPPYVLLAWIPEALVERVQKAMDVSVTEPLLWLEDAAIWDQTRRTVERFIDFLT